MWLWKLFHLISFSAVPFLMPWSSENFWIAFKPLNILLRGNRKDAVERKAKSRTVTNIIKAVPDPMHTREQQVLGLREVIRHKDLKLHWTGAGMMLDNKLLYYAFKNIKNVLPISTRTSHQFGRPTDDLRSLFQTIVLAALPSPNATKEYSER